MTFDQVWADVQANSKKLRECPGPHDFVQEGEGIRRMYRCSKCGGTVDPIRYYWYLEGLRHGMNERFQTVEEDPDIEDPEPMF